MCIGCVDGDPCFIKLSTNFTVLIQTQMASVGAFSLSKHVAPPLCVVTNHQFLRSMSCCHQEYGAFEVCSR